MKATDGFKNMIKAHLDKRAAEDELFAVSYEKPNKSIDECINYILNDVKKSGYNAFAPDEIYSMAIHYYDEDNIKDVKPIDCRVVVSQSAGNSEVEKKKDSKKAAKKLKEEPIATIKKPAVQKKAGIDSRQMNLF